jgi:CBS domain-containing protein
MTYQDTPDEPENPTANATQNPGTVPSNANVAAPASPEGIENPSQDSHHYAGAYVAPAESLFKSEEHAIETIMDKDPYCCLDSATMTEVADILIDKKISSMPVVDKDWHVVGFISDGDIMRALATYEPRSIFTGSPASMVFFDDEPISDKIGRLKARNVMELATRKVVCARPGQTIGRVARTLSKKQFKKMPVVDAQGRLVGMIRRKSIMKYAFTLMFHDGQSAQDGR